MLCDAIYIVNKQKTPRKIKYGNLSYSQRLLKNGRKQILFLSITSNILSIIHHTQPMYVCGIKSIKATKSCWYDEKITKSNCSLCMQ